MSTITTKTPIIITLLVKRKPNLHFNEHHLLTVHVPLVAKHWGPHGLVERTATRVVDETSEYAYAITMKWESEESWESAKNDEEGMAAVLGDVAGVTDGELVFVVGRVIA
ncbi:unnamed protein product [Periconia digitata]|uniref:EthD domain-containing protein n=1 Tax=Periconia digitata TaxID=1303443 RepID=A0A9W4UUK9_9PLEO|nr:unnamed protein product [Periconia digitata]